MLSTILARPLPLPRETRAPPSLRYHAPIGSTELAERLRIEKDVLVVPGDHFGMDGFIRVGFGLPREELMEALARIASALDEVADGPPDPGRRPAAIPP